MMPPTYYRELRQLRNEIEVCQKCGKEDREFPYSCCSVCRSKQAIADARRAQDRREASRHTSTKARP